MGIELALTDQQPACNRNRVFLTRLEILQAQSSDDALPPRYAVQIEYKRYGVDPQGVRHFSGAYSEINVQDFLASAMQKAAQGDMSMISALQAIEGAVAAIIADDLNTTANLI